MSRYRVGRILAGVLGALSFVAVLVSLLVVVIGLAGSRTEPGSLLHLVGPAILTTLGGLFMCVASCAAIALFDLADRACGP